MCKLADTDVKLLWRAADGSEWDWMSGADGVIAGRGIQGVLFPDFDQRMSETRSGARWAGVRWKPRKVQVTMQVGDNVGSVVAGAGDAYRRGARWRDLDRRFRGSLNPMEPGTLVCQTPEGERSIQLLTDGVGDKTEAWPDIRGWQEYDVDFTAESALWSGTPVNISIPYSAGGSQDYYRGKGPNFLISEGTVQSSRTVQNPGDAPAWPVWTISGPGQFTVGVGEHVTVTAPLGADETLVIDTEKRSVTDGTGASAWGRLVSRDFAQIPRGSSSDVVVSAVDASAGSSVSMTIVPQFLGAY